MNEFQPLPESVRTLWLATTLIIALVFFGLVAGVETVIRQSSDPGLPPYLLPVALTLLISVPALFMVNATWKRWGFQLTDQWLRTRRGVFSHHEDIVPRNRVQTVSSSNGPLDRMLNLTSVQIHTAGIGSPTIAIPHLADETVEWLQTELGRGAARETATHG